MFIAPAADACEYPRVNQFQKKTYLALDKKEMPKGLKLSTKKR